MKKLFITIVILGAIGYGIYYFGTNVASDKLLDSASTELENSGQINDLKAYIESDPELSRMIKEAESADESTLPFTSKGEATRVLIKKVGITKLQEVQSQVQNGTASKDEVLQVLNEKLTDEEMLALQVIAYKEIYKK
ncbi:hypothetical protein [Paenisporosarcina sp. OV554]|uniref:hypothetical protein n=1 Tax=Paenisporosarcina sp. OV554 TaxID=2135694 RepID=UPI000D37F244|nr:hypothetical protein [Paenisporosarcina sp. OV554]PUB11960.1 hypothetical protein C8K15_11150 [Paenisporosarcina sp. OV554]